MTEQTINPPVFDIMRPYTDLIREILVTGEEADDRTGTGTIKLFARMLTYDVRHNAPLYTQRRIPIKSILGELLWFIEGSTDAKRLKEVYKCSFWDEWADEYTGSIGPMYGEQWRNADGVDQFAQLLNILFHNPTSRRMVVDVWSPSLIPDGNTPPKDNPLNGLMALAPCHFAWQVNTEVKEARDPVIVTHEDGSITSVDNNDYYVDLMFHLRSSDLLLGYPANLASYYFLLQIICTIVNSFVESEDGLARRYYPRKLISTLGDVHIYKNHIEAAKELVDREPLPPATFEMPISGDEFLAIVNEGKRMRKLQITLAEAVKDYVAHDTIELARNI